MSDSPSATLNEMRESAAVAVIATLVSHIALMKTLLNKGLLSHEELAEFYTNPLSTKNYPPGAAEFLDPIWAELRKQIDMPENRS